ncbi:hypothetical protein ERO13_D08G028900v2 [Gossypium hirsutum]|uniref:Defensin-like protein n=3 Tax=Gossypium TaxID=3633 RepID=A0A5J5Q8S2_GOSBA|nr:hypothetical protein ES319_D08G025000v1 [Gossypium barbadense]KAG4132387.1 hypothetical protein ERO13_D08G028900v2 [Gossypium hirsutum]TYG55983.1 hypothetical protein ES288_D08G026500v1 [Gossypium darwinii]TYH56539.1 hypothetical protein ES332_D08G026000v1 [Gossypium tomentosum]
MIKSFSLLYIFAILLLFTSGKVNCAVCEEQLGKCDENCDFKCQTSKNGKGICDENGICKCVYECKGPGTKSCNVGIGPCSEHCSDDCCEQNCEFKYPGVQDGHGFCLDIAGIPASNQCLCYFYC